MPNVLDAVTPPAPDPKLKPKTADDMADEGDREGPVLIDGARLEEVETERDPQFAKNGE